MGMQNLTVDNQIHLQSQCELLVWRREQGVKRYSTETVGEAKSEVRLEGCERAEGGPGGVHGTHKSPTGVAGEGRPFQSLLTSSLGLLVSSQGGTAGSHTGCDLLGQGHDCGEGSMIPAGSFRIHGGLPGRGGREEEWVCIPERGDNKYCF